MLQHTFFKIAFYLAVDVSTKTGSGKLITLSKLNAIATDCAIKALCQSGVSVPILIHSSAKLEKPADDG